MFSACLKRAAWTGLLRRALSTRLPLLSEAAVRPLPKLNAEKDPKKLHKRLQKKMNKHKEPPQTQPLYMDIPTALKYIRAAEVGQEASRTTIKLQIVVVPQKGSPVLQGLVVMPKLARIVRPVVFTKDAEQQRALEEANKYAVVGDEQLVKRVALGSVKLTSLHVVYATPEMVPLMRPIMPRLGKKGMVPNAKNGRVGENVVELVLRHEQGTQSFKQASNALGFVVGRCDFTDEEIIRNIRAVADVVAQLQPAGTKHPNVIGHCHISSAYSPSIVIDIRP